MQSRPVRKIPLYKVISVIREHHPYAWTWERDDLKNWVAWYAKQGLLLCITNDGRTVAGLIMFRTVMRAVHGVGNNLNYDPEGSVVFVDFFYAPTELIKRGLIVAAIHRIGRRETVAWERHMTLRVYPARRFVLHSLRKETV